MAARSFELVRLDARAIRAESGRSSEQVVAVKHPEAALEAMNAV